MATGPLTQAFIQESGAASLPWSLPAPPIELLSDGACPSSAPHDTRCLLNRKVRGPDTQGEPLPCPGRQPKARQAGTSPESSLTAPPRLRWEEQKGSRHMQSVGSNLSSQWPGPMPAKMSVDEAHALQPFPSRGTSAKKRLVWRAGDRVGEVAGGQLTSSPWEGRKHSWEQP